MSIRRLNSMRNIGKSRAIVLRKRALPQKDLVVTLFTQEYGKVIVISKGARTLASKRASHLQSGNLLEANLELGDEYAYLKQTSLVSAFGKLKESFPKLQFLYTFLFVLDRILPERQQESNVYEQTIRFLSGLSVLESGFGGYTERSLDMILGILGYYREQHIALAPYIEELLDAKLPLHDII
ncbi:MAG: DNA repair protein RecO [Patescibacteria group bacterium]|nr:DNA repair protein RecO [Patescibacteria group bacterium]